jgi:hypothetical protein
MFNLRSGLKDEWIDTDLPDNTAGWRSEWFYMTKQIPFLLRRTGHKPLKISEWDIGLPTHDIKNFKGVPELVSDTKETRSDGSGGGEVVLPADDSADQASGPPGI